MKFENGRLVKMNYNRMINSSDASQTFSTRTISYGKAKISIPKVSK